MADKYPTPNDNVRIFAPDTRLQDKIGPGVALEQVITPQALNDAQQVIKESADDILSAIKTDLVRLGEAADTLKPDAQPGMSLPPVIEAAFAIKSKAAFCGYSFASSLAKSLQIFCETDAARQPLTPKTIEIIQAQVAGLQTIFTNKLAGDGGTLGATILAELQKLSGKTL